MINIVSMSGGKDSTATACVAIVQEVENPLYVFADTGNEHPETYAYIDYLESALGIKIQRLKADFSLEIERKRNRLSEFLENEEAREKSGWTINTIERALTVLIPTGNPFLDLCLWKGRFPSTNARFCTQELKVKPIFEQVFIPLLDQGEMVLSWQGVRRDESLARRYLPECDEVGGGLFNYRPILKWSVESVFEAHRYMGVKPNPLYTQGCSRVGCMPCINCGKDELAEIALRFPEEVARVREWEMLVSFASRRQASTFFPVVKDPTVLSDDIITPETHGIDRMVQWAQTERGGRKLSLITLSQDPKACKSAYGLCEGK